jgi:hypothetical protein
MWKSSAGIPNQCNLPNCRYADLNPLQIRQFLTYLPFRLFDIYWRPHAPCWKALITRQRNCPKCCASYALLILGTIYTMNHVDTTKCIDKTKTNVVRY